MSSSYNFKDNLTIDNNKYLKWLDITGTSRANIISLDNVNNVKINSAFGNLVLNSESDSSYTFLNVNGNVSGVIIGSKIGIGFNTTTNMNAALTLNKNSFIGINTTTGSNDGYLGLSGTSSLNSTGSRIILYGNESSSSNNGKLNLYAGNTSNGTINLFTADDKMRLQILNNGTLNVLPDGITSRLIINDTSSTFTNDVILASGTASTNATTGALTVSGGLGITGSVYILGSLSLTTTSVGNLNFSSSNPSTSYSSGAVVLTGGLGISTTVNSSSVTAGGGLSIAGGAAIGKDLYLGGKFKILDSTSATSSENASVVLYGGLGINSNILSRTDSAPQIKLSPTTDKSETSISFYSKNNFTSTSNTGSSWTLGQNVNSISSGNFALANSQFGTVLSAEYNGKLSILGDVHINSQTLKIPKGTTDQRPVSAEQGFIRYNSELEQFEGYGSGNSWGSLGGGGGGGGSATTAGNIIANSINLGVSNMFSGSFTPSNNVSVASNVTGLSFNNSDIRSFIVNLTVSITRTVGGNLYESFTLEGNQIGSSWELLVSSIGDVSGFNFTITSLGQIQYTSTNITNYSNSIIRYHVNEITNTGTYDRSGLETQGTLITNTMQILNTQDAIIGVNNGALYVAGGVTIAKTLYVSSGRATISNITSTNIVVTNISTNSIIIDNSNNSNGIQVGVGTGNTTSNLNLYGSFTDGYAIIQAGSTNNNSPNLKIVRSATSVGTIANFQVYSQTSAFIGGSVGIGTTAPSGTLSIVGPGTGGTIRIYPNTPRTETNIAFHESSTDGSNLWFIGQGPYNNGTNFCIGQTGFGGPMMVFTTAGNVGIGTSAPGEILDVRGNLRIGKSTQGNYISFHGTSGDEPNNYTHTYIGERLYGGTENSELLLFKGNDISGPSGPDRIRHLAANHLFDTYTSALSGTFAGVGASGTTRMLIDQNGNVGIGTTAPTYTLDVTGTCDVSTSITTAALYSTNITSTNIVGTNISAGTLALSNVNVSTVTIGSLYNSSHMIVGTLGSYITSPKIWMYGREDTTNPLYVIQPYDSGNIGMGLGAYFNASGTPIMSTTSTGWLVGKNPDGFGVIKCSGSVGSTASVSYPFTIYNNHNVGIGHNIPKSTLHLSPSNNNTTGNILFEAGFTSDGGNAGWTAMNFNGYNNAGEQRINTNKNRWRLVVDQRSTDDTMFIDTFNGSTGTTLMTFKTSGNVGIGTTAPGSALHVTGTIGALPIGTGIHMGTDFVNNASIIQINQGGSTSGFSIIDFGYSNTNYVSRIIHNNSDKNLEFVVNAGTSAMTISSSGNVGIGKSSPSTTLDVNGTIRSSYEMIVGTSGSFVNYPKLHMFFTSNLTNPIISLGAFDNFNQFLGFGVHVNTLGETIMSSSTTAYSIGRINDAFLLQGYNGTLGSHANTTTAGVLKIKTGNFSINGSIDPFTTLSMNGGTVGNGAIQIISLPNTVNSGRSQDGASFKAWSDGNNILQFFNSAGVIRGFVGGNGASGVTYNTSSDRRLKENVVNMSNSINIVKQMRPVEFTWKSDNRPDYGFIAQEIYDILPNLRPNFASYSHCECTLENISNGVLCECPDHDHDEPVDKEGNPLYYGLDYGKITPYLTKALQETIAELEKLRQDFEEYKNTHP